MNMVASQKLDLTKHYPEYYKAKDKPQIVNFEPYNYITTSGISAPEDSIFMEAIEKLYSLAYGIKFTCKAHDLDFIVPKMEGFWWVDGALSFEDTPRKDWHWKIMFRMPDFVGEMEYRTALEELIEKSKISEQHDLVFEEVHEGLSAQLLHLGSYDNETASLEKLYSFIKQEGFEIAGYHHEIYLSDPRKVAEEKLRTILRYAIR